MPRPVPDAKEAREKGAEVERLVAALGGLQAASAALTAISKPIRWDSLRRYVRAERIAPDDILDGLRSIANSRPRWIVGRDENRGRWIVHLHTPRFAAQINGNALGAITWIDGKPEARRHGMLITDAEAYLAK